MDIKKARLFPFYLELTKAYKGYLFGLFFVALYWGINNALSPYLLKLIVDKASDFQAEKALLLSSLQPYVFLYLFSWIAIAAVMRFGDWIKMQFFASLRFNIINKMFVYLNQHSHRYFQNNFSGSLSNKITDMNSGTVAVFTTLDDALGQGLGLCIAIGTLLIIHPFFALILVAWALLFLVITFCFIKPIQASSFDFAKSKTTLVGKLVDSISNISNVRLFSKNNFEKIAIEEATEHTVHNDKKMQKTILVMRVFWDLSIVLLIGLDIYLLVAMYAKGQVSLGDFSFIITLSINIFYNLWYLAGQFVSFTEDLGKCRQALSIITAPHEIKDAPGAKKLEVKKGCIRFEKVYFSYDQNKAIFKDKNVTIEAGEKIGLVGFSGSGKSTFVNLILRIFDVKSGSISIDNQDIKEVTQASLRENIAMIPQDITLFHRTLMENIRYGREDASDEEVIEASKKAHCHEFIMEMEEGYQTQVGERGIKISGGQRQRIAIARAILKNAPILILDEATSALDSVTEKKIQESLQGLMKDRTTLVIAHRLSTLSEMDRVLVFDKGIILEEGNHAELLKNNNHYAKMWSVQASGFRACH